MLFWEGIFFFRGDFWNARVTFPKRLKTFPGPIRSATGKENYIGSAVREILSITESDRYPVNCK